MADRVAMTIEHARLNHQRVECGPGVPGCGPDCEGDEAGKPVGFCPTCGPWPCSTSVLLGEVDKLRAERDRVLAALAVQEREFYARAEAANDGGVVRLDEGFRQGMGRDHGRATKREIADLMGAGRDVVTHAAAIAHGVLRDKTVGPAGDGVGPAS